MGKKKKKIKVVKKKIFDLDIKIWWAIIGFAVITIILYISILSPKKMLGGDDQLIAGYIFRDFLKKEISSGTFPFWNPYIFSGLPFIDAIHGDTFYISTLLRLLFPATYVVSLLFIIHTFLAGIGMLLYLKSEGLSKTSSTFGGAAFMLTGLLVSQANAGHDGRMIVISLFPWLFYFISMGIKKERFIYFMLSSLIIGLALLSPHVQLSYYMLMAVFIYFVFTIAFSFKKNEFLKTIRLLVYFIAGIFTGIALSAIQFLPSLDYVKYSPRLSRGYEFATQFSMPPFELLDQITPHLSGLKENYWGWYVFKQHTEYTGIIVFLLAIFGMFKFIKKKKVIIFTTIFGFGTLLAWGKYLPFSLYRIPYTIIPFISKLRAPNMFFSLSVFAIVVLASISLDFIVREKKFKKIIILPLVISFFYFSTIMFKNVYLSIFSSYIKNAYTISQFVQQKIDLLYTNFSNFHQGLLWASLLTWVFYFILKLSEKNIGKNIAILLITFLTAIDLIIVDKKFIKTIENPQLYYKKDPIVNYLKKDSSLYRIFPIFYKDNDCYSMYHRIQNIGGYHGNQLGDYQKFIGAKNTIMFKDYTNLYYKNFVDLLNVKYIVAPRLPEDLSSYPYYVVNRINAIKNLIRYYKKTVDIGDYTIYKNKPVARIFPLFKVKYVEREEMLNILKDTSFNIRKTALLEKNTEKIKIDSTGEGYARITKYSPNRIEAEVEVTKPSLIFFSELYYPSWKAKVDDKKEKVYRVNYIFRGIPVETGKHRIILFYSSSLFKIGMLISLISLLFILISIVFHLTRKKREK